MPYSPAVKIVGTPGGEAPLDVCEAPVGLTLPLTDATPRMFEPDGVLTRTKQSPRVGYQVVGCQAVTILAEKAPWAAGSHPWREPGTSTSLIGLILAALATGPLGLAATQPPPIQTGEVHLYSINNAIYDRGCFPAPPGHWA